MSWRDLLAPARAPAPRWSPSASQESQARAAGEGAGSGWAPQARADLSNVRVHADAEAAGLAEDYGAKAFTYGQDIFLGSAAASGRADGAATLAHETAHAAQQADQPGPAMQFEPKGSKAGPGASPPEEDFIDDQNNWGAEDGHVLFGQDQASLLTDEDVQDFAAKQKQAVSVHVHGYASDEGPADYNLNLSAHRAVAIRARLLELLPQGSRVAVFAHGKSQHFGAAEKNRRVGLSLIGPVDQGFQLNMDFGKPPAAWRDRVGLDEPPNISRKDLFPTGLPPGSFGVTPSGPPLGGTLQPPIIPRHLMDLAGMGRPGALHGHSVGETGNVFDQFDSAYLKYQRLGLPDRLPLSIFGFELFDFGAASLANMEVESNNQAYWERNDPTHIDTSNRDAGAKIKMFELWREKQPKK